MDKHTLRILLSFLKLLCTIIGDIIKIVALVFAIKGELQIAIVLLCIATLIGG